MIQFDNRHGSPAEGRDEDEGTTRPAPLPAESREGLLEEEDRKRELLLKNGGRIAAGEGLVQYNVLKHLLDTDPQHFQALRAIAEGRPGDVTPEQTDYLRRCSMLRPDDGTLNPGKRDVLLSAYQETEEGPVLVNPFKLDDQEQVRLLERLERAAFKRLHRFIRGNGGEDDSPGRG